MKRKTVATVLSLILACSMLISGCGNDSSPSTSSNPGSTSSDSSGGQSSDNSGSEDSGSGEVVSTGKPGYDYIASLPKLSDELVSFRVVAYQETSQIDYNEMNIFKELEKATNVHIDFDCYPGSTYGDQKNLMLASGEYPDAFFGYMTLGNDDLEGYGPMGVFIPLEDMIEEYCTNYKKVLEEVPALDGLTTSSDGHKYSMGSINDSPSRDFPDNLLINKTWLDNLGLDVPTTMEEYYDVLKAFKEQDANGNGDPNDEIPYTFIPWNHINGYGGFFGAYGEAEAFNNAGGTLNHFVVDDNEKVIYNPITEEYKTAIKELGRFVQDGLWDEDGFVQSAEQYQAKQQNPTAIVGSCYTWGLTSIAAANQDQYIPIKPLKATADSPDAKVHLRRNHISISSTGFSITNNCQNPEILMQWVDLFYSDVMTVLSYYGIDRLTEITEDGHYRYDESSNADGTTFLDEVQHLNPFDGCPKYLTTELRYEKIQLETVTDDKIDTTLMYYVDAPASRTLPSMRFTPEESQFVNDYGSAIQNYVEQKQQEWLLGRADIDADWDAYLAQLNTLRLQEFIDTMQGAYDRTIGK